ncbi:DUF6484 domain-containing protein [Candidatus Electrothrix aarhusensis]|jgi:hypothetical protein
MSKAADNSLYHMRTESSDEAPTEGVRVGRVIRINDSGQPLVDFSGNQRGPLAARFTGSLDLALLREAATSGKEVLLAFENNDPARPVIIDTLFSLLDEVDLPARSAKEEEELELEPEQDEELTDVTVDGKKVTFHAEEEIVLRCGKASITLTKAGKVVIRGAYLLNRSSGVNRIKGGSVQIN